MSERDLNYVMRMAASANAAACANCGKLVEDVKAMIQVFNSTATEPALWCMACWYSKGDKAATPAYVRPEPRDPRASLSVSVHKTREAARDRAVKVAAYLGVLPNVNASGPDGDGPFTVMPDSPLVPGFDKVKGANPFDR